MCLLICRTRGHLGAISGSFWAHLGLILGPPGVLFGLPWGLLAMSRQLLALSWRLLGSSWRPSGLLGPFQEALASSDSNRDVKNERGASTVYQFVRLCGLGYLWHAGAILGPIWGHFVAILRSLVAISDSLGIVLRFLGASWRCHGSSWGPFGSSWRLAGPML